MLQESRFSSLPRANKGNRPIGTAKPWELHAYFPFHVHAADYAAWDI
jgi:hypothetical protein